MKELACKADQVSVIKGRLGLHQEFGAELAALNLPRKNLELKISAKTNPTN